MAISRSTRQAQFAANRQEAARKIANTRFATYTFTSPPIQSEAQDTTARNIGELSNSSGYFFEACVAYYFAQSESDRVSLDLNPQQVNALEWFKTTSPITTGKNTYLTADQFDALRANINNAAKDVVNATLKKVFKSITPSGNADAVDFMGQLKDISGTMSLEMKFQYSKGNIKYFTLNDSAIFNGAFFDFLISAPNTKAKYWSNKLYEGNWINAIRREAFAEFLSKAAPVKPTNHSPEFFNYLLSKGAGDSFAKTNKQIVYGYARNDSYVSFVLDLDAIIDNIKHTITYDLPGRTLKLKVLAQSPITNQSETIAGLQVDGKSVGKSGNTDFTFNMYLTQKFLAHRQ